MISFGKFQSTDNLKPLKKPVLPCVIQFQFKCGTYPTIQISTLKLPRTPHAYRLVEQTFSAKMTTYEKLQLTNNSKSLRKQGLL